MHRLETDARVTNNTMLTDSQGRVVDRGNNGQHVFVVMKGASFTMSY